MKEVNKSALLLSMAAEMFHNGLNPRISIITSTAFIGAVDYMDDYEDFMEALLDGLKVTSIHIKGLDVQPKDVIDGEEVFTALIAANYLTEDGIGTRMGELLERRKEAYAPVTGEVERRFGYAAIDYSELFVEAIHALEATRYTVDEEMLSLALQVDALRPPRLVMVKGVLVDIGDPDAYVLRGCTKMDSKLGYVSEFKGDSRLRMYQSACHGPMGGASDRSRALQNLHGVPTDYDIPKTKRYILAEMEDMVSNVKESAKELKELGEVQFILKHHLKTPEVKKAYSFVKAVLIMRKLQSGERPYIGMAIGLDCKCSGTQLASLMVGDEKLAAACGMSLVQLEDAYQMAVKSCEDAGFIGITRSLAKEVYMAVFFGQAWGALTDPKEVSPELWEVLYGKLPANDDVAKRLHQAISKVFGRKINGVRSLMKMYGKITAGRTKHFLPDGSQVAMNYKEKVNILGETMVWGSDEYDVDVRNNADTYKFINLQFNTKIVDAVNFARNGFVNMVHGVDGLLARMIIVNLKRAGAQHIIGVHDCFRVNVHDMPILEEAVKKAYLDLFGGDYNDPTKDLPLGLDILGMYFEGANKQLLPGNEPMMVSQFYESGKRRMRKVNGEKVSDLISALGTSYYFAK